MAIDIQMKLKSEKRFLKFANFGEYLFWSYANLQMLCAALNMGKTKYDKSCYMIRVKAFKAYKEGRWQINDLFKNNMTLLFNYRYIPLDYPQPEVYT
jgi:hypothetical protein